MRKLALAIFMAATLAVVSVAPTFASSPHGPFINVWGTINTQSHGEIDGNLVVPPGSHGITTLALYESNDGHTWLPGPTHQLNLVNGQTNYSFSFDIDAGPKHFTFYRVVGDGAGSRNFNRDECGFRVPEAPATPLLLLGAFPAGALIAVKATGVRLPLPHLHRVA
jgi:hypothetical protein